MAKPRPRRKMPPAKKLNSRLPRLSDLHRKVVDEYFKNGCVSERRAMRAAGYAENSPPSLVFHRQDVRDEITRRRDNQVKRQEATEDWIVEQYRKIAAANLGDLLEVNEDGSAWLDMSKITEDHKAALAEFTVETYEEKTFEPGEGDEKGQLVVRPVKKSRIKFLDKKTALDALARIRGMFKDKVEVTGAMSLVERIQRGRERTTPE